MPSTQRSIVVTLAGQRRIDAAVGHHTIHTDQPIDNGGEDSAPTPFELFLASLGTCAGIFVQGFCAARRIAYEGTQLIERPRYDDSGLLRAVEIDIELPPGFPEHYRDALVKAVSQCSVKRAIAAQPEIQVETHRVDTATADAAH